jgi:hypothetical protein
MRIIFVLSTLTRALNGLAGPDVSFASSFAGILAIAGLTGITWREQFQMLPWCRSAYEPPARPQASLPPIMVVRLGRLDRDSWTGH